MTTDEVLRKFIDSKEPTAFALQGAWGVGKSHLWRALVEEAQAEGTLSNTYTYVSLFGINSLETLKAAVAYAAGTDKELPSKTLATKAMRVASRWGRKVAKELPTAVSAVPSGHGGGGAVANVINSFSFYLVRDRLICLDDIERRGDKLSLVDCLGLVTFLTEQRNCRVCVILNSGALRSDSRVWAEQKEKVFVAEVAYDPQLDESIRLGLRGIEEHAWYSAARDALTDLRIKNVRLMRRMVRLLTMVFQIVAPQTAATRTAITRNLIFLEYAHSGRALGAPPIEFALSTGGMALAIEDMRAQRGESQMSAQERAWAQQMREYGFEGNDELPKALYDTVTNGFPETKSLSLAVNAAERDNILNAKREAFHEAWRMYHDHVDDNGTETVNAMWATWQEVSDRDHVSNLLGVVRLMRTVGREVDASRAIDSWLNARRGARIGELDLSELTVFGPIQDEEFLAKRAAVISAHTPDVSILEALQAIGERVNLDDHIWRVAHASPAELLEVLKQNPGGYITKAVTACLELTNYDGGHVERGTASSNMREALRINSASSAWCAERNRSKYRIEP